jgi:hypothetical protein
MPASDSIASRIRLSSLGSEWMTTERPAASAHRQRCLAGAYVSKQPQAASGVQVLADPLHVAAHDLHLFGRDARDVADRGPVKRHAAVPARHAPGEAARSDPRDLSGAARAVTRRVRGLVDHEAAAVADAQRARVVAAADVDVAFAGAHCA